MTPPPDMPRPSFLAQSLFVGGLLIVMTSGLCSAGAFFLLEPWKDPVGRSILLVVGGTPFLFGIICTWIGRRLWRQIDYLPGERPVRGKVRPRKPTH